MPYAIKKLPNGQWARVRRDTGKIVSRHKTRAKAIQAAAIVAKKLGEPTGQKSVQTFGRSWSASKMRSC